LAKAGKEQGIGRRHVKEDPEYVFLKSSLISSYQDRAGQSLVLHKDSPRQEAWNRLKDSNPILRSFALMRQAYDESENPVVSSMRSVTQTIGSWFDENETAQVQRLMKMLDPAFNHESFERELREYIVPEVVDAYLSADQEALKAWCGEAVRKPSRSQGSTFIS